MLRRLGITVLPRVGRSRFQACQPCKPQAQAQVQVHRTYTTTGVGAGTSVGTGIGAGAGAGIGTTGTTATTGTSVGTGTGAGVGTGRSSRLIGDGSFLPHKEKFNVTVIGGGNSAHVLAGYVGSMGNVDVSILNTVIHEKDMFEKNIHKSMTVRHRNGQEDIVGKISTVSCDPAETIPHADLVLVAVPAHVHEHYFRLIVPHVRPNQSIGVMTAQGCLDLVARDIFRNNYELINFFSFETLPWACRLVNFGYAAEVLGAKVAVDVACHPHSMTSHACNVISQLLSRGEPYTSPPNPSHPNEESSRRPSTPVSSSDVSDLSPLPYEEFELEDKRPRFIAGANQLAITLMNINSVWHPCITYGQFHTWDGKTPILTGPPRFYEGVDDFTADVLNEVSNEILFVKEALLRGHPHLDLDVVRHVGTWILEAYGNNIVDKSTLRTCITSNKAYAGLSHPMVPASTEGLGLVPDISHRFWVEDLPCGLVATRGIAELAGVDTPTMDSVIMWMQEHKGKEYLVQDESGKTLLKGKDLHETRAPQRYGITHLSEIIHEYEHL